MAHGMNYANRRLAAVQSPAEVWWPMEVGYFPTADGPLMLMQLWVKEGTEESEWRRVPVIGEAH